MLRNFEHLSHAFGAREGSRPAGTRFTRQYIRDGVRVDSESTAAGAGCGHAAYRCRACGLVVCEIMVSAHATSCEGQQGAP